MKTRLMNKENVYGIFLTLPEPWGGFIEVIAHQGYDFVVLDAEHGGMSFEKMEELARVARLAKIHAIVRICDKQYDLAARSLDMGCSSIMIPRVEELSQVEKVAGYAKYPPDGKRGAGGFMNLFESDKKKFLRQSNEEGMLIAQIESEKGIQNLESIAGAPCVDAIFIGPFDLSVDLGIPGEFGDERFKEKVRRILLVCSQKNKPVGIHMGNPVELRYWRSQGMNLISVGSDLGFFCGKSKEMLVSVTA